MGLMRSGLRQKTQIFTSRLMQRPRNRVSCKPLVSRGGGNKLGSHIGSRGGPSKNKPKEERLSLWSRGKRLTGWRFKGKRGRLYSGEIQQNANGSKPLRVVTDPWHLHKTRSPSGGRGHYSRLEWKFKRVQ